MSTSSSQQKNAPKKPVPQSQLNYKRDLLVKKQKDNISSTNVINIKKMTDIYVDTLAEVYKQNPTLPKEQKTAIAVGTLRAVVHKLKSEPERVHTTREIDAMDTITDNIELLESIAESFSVIIDTSSTVVGKIKTAAKGYGCCA